MLAEPEGLHGPTIVGMTPAGRAAWALWASAVLCLAAIGWFDQLLRQAGRPDLVPRPLYPPFQSVPNPFGVHVLVGPLRVAWAAAAIVSGFGLVVAAASLVVRFRHARGTERQQLRWVALAAALSGMVAVVALAGQVLGLRPLGGRARPPRRLAGPRAPLNDGEGGAEPLEGLDRVAGGPGLQADDAGVAEPVEGGRDRGVVDLTGSRLAAAGDVGDLDLADQRQRALHELDQVSLADLGVVEVEVQS
jgi:hypothetical protein